MLTTNQRIIGPYLSLIFKKKQGQAKVTVVVSKKTAKRAVDRNRAKRLIRQALTDRTSQIKGELVIIVRRNIANLKMPAVELVLEDLFGKLK